MAKKRPKLDKNKRVKALARERVGAPKPGRAIPEKNSSQLRSVKHKKKLIANDEPEGATSRP